MSGISVSSSSLQKTSKLQIYPKITSASGILSLLIETEWPLRIHALHKLNEITDRFWPEIADFLTDIEKLYEDVSFPERGLAALVVSKVYYHLEEYEEAVQYALGAGPLLDIAEKSQYVQMIIAKCIDGYVALRTKLYDAESAVKSKDAMEVDEEGGEVTAIDSRLEAVVERVLEVSKYDGDERQALGIALDARRLDKVEEIIMHSSNPVAILEYCTNNAQSLIPTKRFRLEVLELVSTIYYTLPQDVLEGQYPQLCQCLFYRNDVDGVASILSSLMVKGGDSTLMAYQIAFDLVDFEDQAFLRPLISHPDLTNQSTPIEVTAASTEDEQQQQTSSDNSPSKISTVDPQEMERLYYILSGAASIELRLQFLHRNNVTDLVLLDNYRVGADARNSITHHGIIIAHGLMQAGTTSDTFLRFNLEWLGKAAHWAKFSAAASLGLINKGHVKASRTVLAKYLPTARGAKAYSEGGAFYALGLIHANHCDQEIKEYLLNELRMANDNQILHHGACLGLGLLCMGQHDEDLFDKMKTILLLDSAISGEAAAYAIGLIMLGSASKPAVDELLACAQETQHEKIIRASAVAISMIMFRKEEDADELIEQMIANEDALIRYGAMFTIGMAYCGTARNSVIRRLLHISVSDVSDDVRRAAVIALGFVLCNIPEQLPRILNLLSESYNPHVRYGAALAIGISSAGTAGVEAVNLLISMTSDGTDFVRQGALIGLGLVLQQANEKMIEKVKKAREIIERVISDRHEDIITRFGATLATGLIDAGGRNVRATFFSKSGNIRQEAAVGFCLFAQLWYWFPLIHGISLAFQATALIGLTKELKMPANFSVLSKAKESTFAYTPPVQREKKEPKKGGLGSVLKGSSKTQRNKSKRGLEASSNISTAAPKPLSEGLANIKTREKPLDEMASIASERPSVKGLEISSTAATAGGYSSRLSHTGSTADSVDESAVTGSDDVNESISTQTEGGSAASVEPKIKKSEEAPVSSTAIKEEEKKDTNLDAKNDKINSTNVEASFCELSNPCRVLPQQEPFIEYKMNTRYIPVYPHRKSGFLLLRDTTPELPAEYVEPKLTETKEEEAEPPEPFEWTD